MMNKFDNLPVAIVGRRPRNLLIFSSDFFRLLGHNFLSSRWDSAASHATCDMLLSLWHGFAWKLNFSSRIDFFYPCKAEDGVVEIDSVFDVLLS